LLPVVSVLCSCFLFSPHLPPRSLHSFPTRRSSDLGLTWWLVHLLEPPCRGIRHLIPHSLLVTHRLPSFQDIELIVLLNLLLVSLRTLLRFYLQGQGLV